ncbi:cell division protein FtsA [Amphibacillus marinus]|uniref:Cell division protein FtsA n=1 Tax=Amphibacillus marinus TaxID=872970 RepID=A0A1H8T1C1_9BACI|nr:cell division protein FtsA [Amphibacillus marinus]SEO84303.1 cell division protein FtsA [Amphibacillus marinus]
MDNTIFALDIGTRSVIGLLLEATGNQYTLIDYVIREHEDRSMLDGQIHDVIRVAEVINQVKQDLEERHQIQLKQVCVAAAGRALKTRRTKVEKNIKQHPLIKQEDIAFLELSAVQQAQHDLALEEENSQTHYYCVGYSILQYKLDHDIIGSLIDQQGAVAEVEIIATFLPKVVVESLLSALQRANLEMEALTLEPIAAINVLIPESMRRLNVALVDIGAGTSDIALTDAGTITAYGMVSKAGDEITEAISDAYLLDFNEAERVKREVTNYDTAKVTDILGFEQSVSISDLTKEISPAIEALAHAIANEVLALNNRSPKAVMLIGGGSLTPGLTNHLAAKLNLPNNRVATRGTSAIPALETAVTIPEGPEFITPIGIAIAAKQSPVHYISVTVNQRAVRLFDMKQLSVGDCLLAAGINIEKLYGRPGMAAIISFQDQAITLPGSHGEPPRVSLNGQAITTDHPIQNGDDLIVSKGADGKEPCVTITDVFGELSTFSLFFNGVAYQVNPVLMVNDKTVTTEYLLQDHDKVSIKETFTLTEWLHAIGKQSILEAYTHFEVSLDEKKIILPAFSARLLINGKEASPQQTLQPNDQISFEAAKYASVRDLLAKAKIEVVKRISIFFNGDSVTLEKEQVKVFKDEQPIKLSEQLLPGSSLTTKSTDDDTFIFQDLFRFIELDLSKVKGNLAILKNGQPATFLDPLVDGDEINITF